jgi:hypothetical protein
MSQEAKKGREIISSAYFNGGAEWGLVVSAMFRPLYPNGISVGFHGIGMWLGLALCTEEYGEETIPRPHQG